MVFAGAMVPYPFFRFNYIGYQKHFAGVKAPPDVRSAVAHVMTVCWCRRATSSVVSLQINARAGKSPLLTYTRATYASCSLLIAIVIFRAYPLGFNSLRRNELIRSKRPGVAPLPWHGP